MKLAQNAKKIVLGLPLLIGLPFFFYGGPGYHSARSFQAAWNLGHILYFALVTGWISCGFQPTSLSIPQRFSKVTTCKNPIDPHYLQALQAKYCLAICALVAR